MNALGSLEGMTEELIRRGLPAEYAHRATEELIEHRRDVAEELQAAGIGSDEADAEAVRRLGEPGDLVKKITREYQRRYFCGRWPLVTFLLMPVPIFCCAWIAAAWGSIQTYEILGKVGAALRLPEPSLATKAALKLILLGGATAVLAPLILTLLYYRLSRRIGCNWRWALASVVQIGFLASLLCFHVDLGRGKLWFEPAMLREVFFADDAATFLRSYFVQPSQFLQLVAPLTALVALVWYERRKRIETLDGRGVAC